MRKVIAKVENPLNNRYHIFIDTTCFKKNRQMTPEKPEKLDTFITRLKQQADSCNQTVNMIVNQIIIDYDERCQTEAIMLGEGSHAKR